MNVSPETLAFEGEEERLERQRRTGVLGNGLTVLCLPTDDREVIQEVSRVVCAFKMYDRCHTCPNSKFELVFAPPNPDTLNAQVQCPRWNDKAAIARGEDPDEYEPVEVSTCASQPFDFCRRCPSAKTLADDYAMDKTKPWYGRWRKLRREEFEDG